MPGKSDLISDIEIWCCSNTSLQKNAKKQAFKKLKREWEKDRFLRALLKATREFCFTEFDRSKIEELMHALENY